MSWLKRVFGTKDRAPTTGEAVSKLDEVLAILEKKTTFTESQITEQLEIAKTNAKTNKRIALKALARKRRFEKELTTLDNQASTIEFQRDSLCNARVQTEIFTAMQAAGRALEAAQQHVTIDDVEDLQDQIDDQLQVSEEIRNALSRPLFGMDYDEDELRQDLEELEEEMLSEELTKVDPVPQTYSPDVTARTDAGVPAKRLIPGAAPAAGVSRSTKPGLTSGTGLARLPSVPAEDPRAISSQREEDDLNELAQWAAAM